MKNNPILDANLSCIARYNPNLKSKLLKIEKLTKSISFTQTCLNEPNLLYEDTPLHDVYGAETEAKNIFNKVKNDSSMIHVLYGIGIGYLFQEFALNSKGIVYVYEPDIEILAITLEVVDLTAELSKPNVFVFSDFELLKSHYSSFFNSNLTTVISYLKSYGNLFEKDLKEFVNNLNFAMGAAIIDSNYISKMLIPSVRELCSNIDLLINEPPAIAYKNLYFGKTAVVVSAGPTLDKNIEVLKKYRDRFILLSVGQAVRTLMSNGITPDFVGFVESRNQLSQIEGLDMSEVTLISEPSAYHDLHLKNFKHKISYPSKNSFTNIVWSMFSNVDPSKYVSSGTVSYMMLFSATILGFSDIILVGQDLAFLDGKCYSGLSQHNGINYEIDDNGKAFVKISNLDLFINSLFVKDVAIDYEKKVKIANERVNIMNKNLYSVVGIKGNRLITTLDYAAFIKQFESFALKYGKLLNLYNSSLEGAKIEGFKDVPLEELLMNKPSIEKAELNTNFEYNLNNIVSNIKFELGILVEISKLLSVAKTLIFNFDRSILRDKSLNKSMLTDFRQMMTMYIDLSNIYTKRSRIFALIHEPLKQEIELAIKSGFEITYSSVIDIYTKLKIYITSLHKHITFINSTLESKVKILNEMSNTEG